MKSNFLVKLWTRAPLSWAIIRAVELKLLSTQKFTHPLLEVGCGDGLVSQLLFNKKLGSVDVGIDLNKNELRRSEKTGVYKKLIQADITKAPFADATFATVLANGVLEHIPQLDLALAEISRVLKKNGILITTSPTDNYPKILFYYRLLTRCGLTYLAKFYATWINKQFTHLHLFGHKKWQKRLKAAGLQLVYHKYYNNVSVTGLHDLSLPFAVGTKELKMRTDSMVILPKIRSRFIKFPSRIIENYLDSKSRLFKENASVLLVAKKYEIQ